MLAKVYLELLRFFKKHNIVGASLVSSDKEICVRQLLILLIV